MDLREKVAEQEAEIRRLRHELAVARGETVGSVPSWAEYNAALSEMQTPPARKPEVSLATAREMAAEYARREES